MKGVLTRKLGYKAWKITHLDEKGMSNFFNLKKIIKWNLKEIIND